MGTITIREIAARAGVSISAVSIALNGRRGISDETRARILRIVDESRYTPNPNSRRLLMGRSDTIAVLVDADISVLANLFYSEINNELISASASYGYSLSYAGYTVRGGRVTLPRVITARDAAGIIFLGDPREEVAREVRTMRVPYVVADTHKPQDGACAETAAYVDYEQSAYRAVCYLHERGHGSAGYFGSTNPLYNARVYAGFTRALRDTGLTHDPRWVTAADNDDADAEEKTETLLREWDELPDAVFYSGDILAIGSIRALRRHGVEVPRDLSTVSIDNILLAEYVTPRLTTVNVDRALIARTCLELLVERVEQPGTPCRAVRVRSDELLIRDSVQDGRYAEK